MRSKPALSTLVIAATLIGSGTALAQQCKTPDQVKAELSGAIRTDTILSGDATMWKDLAPPLHPAKPAAGKTREQVKAELAEAIRTGDMYVGDTSRKANEMFPSRYPAQPVVAGKARDQVKAELADAIRTDSILSGDGSTYKDLAPRRYPAAPVTASTNCSPDMPVTAEGGRSV
jgi:hypothetical protein